jgi:hypothetical protein
MGPYFKIFDFGIDGFFFSAGDDRLLEGWNSISIDANVVVECTQLGDPTIVFRVPNVLTRQSVNPKCFKKFQYLSLVTLLFRHNFC